jgi:hypothetical protein
MDTLHAEPEGCVKGTSCEGLAWWSTEDLFPHWKDDRKLKRNRLGGIILFQTPGGSSLLLYLGYKGSKIIHVHQLSIHLALWSRGLANVE